MKSSLAQAMNEEKEMAEIAAKYGLDPIRDFLNENTDNAFVWGAAGIGRVIGRNQRQTLHLLISGKIKSARKIGGHWVANRNALLREFGVE